MYYCVKIDVSAFLAGSTRNDPRWNGRTTTPSAARFGARRAKGIQLSLTPFTHWQRLGVLGFHLALRGLRGCRLAHTAVSIRHPAHVASTERLSSPSHRATAWSARDRGPPATAILQNVLRMDVTTQEFGMSVNRAGTYEFDLVEDARGRQSDYCHFQSNLGYGNQQLI